MVSRALAQMWQRGGGDIHTMHTTQVFSHLHHQLRPQPEALLHVGGPQVQVAILHPQRLRFLFDQSENHNHSGPQANKTCGNNHRHDLTYFDKIFDFKGQLSAQVENFHTLGEDFYLPCRHLLLRCTQENLYSHLVEQFEIFCYHRGSVSLNPDVGAEPVEQFCLPCSSLSSVFSI